MLLVPHLSRIAAPGLARPSGCCRRCFSVLSTNPHIKAFRLATLPPSYLLTLLDTRPPSRATAVGTTTELPPTPRSFQGNPRFLAILNDVMRAYASEDPDLQAQALAFAGPGGAIFSSAGGSGGHGGAGGGSGGTGGASYQGGSGGGGVGGWVHLSDTRNPPDFGRIAWPEDILGSVEVDGRGQLQGTFQPSGTYRLLTNEGILGLSDFLREKLVERLREEETNDQSERPQVLD